MAEAAEPRELLWMQVGDGYVPPADDGWRYHRARWNELPEGVDPARIERLVLSGHLAGLSMPSEVIRRLTNLTQLATDAQMVAFTAADLPKLEELVIVGTSKLTLPEGPWPKLRWVMVDEAPATLVNAAHFPALERLDIRTPGTKKVFREIAKLPGLRKLYVGPIRSDETLAMLEPLRLDRLSFNGGGISSLAMVPRFATLTEFGAKNCHSFSDLGPLAEMPLLEDVSFSFCAGIRKAGALLELPRLKEVMIWGCRENGPELKNVCKKLMDKGVNVRTEILG